MLRLVLVSVNAVKRKGTVGTEEGSGSFMFSEEAGRGLVLLEQVQLEVGYYNSSEYWVCDV